MSDANNPVSCSNRMKPNSCLGWMPINSFFQKGSALSRLGALANKYVVTTDWSDPYKEKQMKLRNKLS